MKIINIAIAAFCLMLLNVSTHALAGSPGGPYVVWVNLSSNTAIEKEFMKRMKESDDLDFENGIFLFKKRPTSITNKLVYKAVVKNDKVAIKLLDRIIRRPFEDFDKGFDGIIVYDEENGPRLSSTTRGWKSFYREKLQSPIDLNYAWVLFCKLVPEITRKP